MALRTIRIAMEGVTGRLGTNQHLIRSLLAIRQEGGLPLQNGDRLMPEPVLLGRNPDKLAALAEAHGGLAWSDDAPKTLADTTIDNINAFADGIVPTGRSVQAKRDSGTAAGPAAAVR